MRFLFLVSIGPVQAFIASARRTRDLHFGSWFLSELAKAAAKEIVNEQGYLIFPTPKSVESLDSEDLNVANKIVALIQQPPEGEDGLGEKVRRAIFRQRDEIREQAYKEIKGDFYRDDADKQIDDLVEYFWVALPFEGNDYEGKRKQLEALMAARKNTRDFSKVTWESDRPKSSISGQLESVIPQYRYARRRETDTVKFEKAKFLYDNYKAGPAEQLSGVDLLKRLGSSKEATGFPSTSHMAAIPFLVRLEDLSVSEKTQAKEKWEKYIEEAEKISGRKVDTIRKKDEAHPILGRNDGSLLFEDRLVDLVDFVDDTYTPQFKQAKAKLQDFFTFIDGLLGKAHPNPYYAILRADGDRMGQVIDMLAIQGYEEHRKLSWALDEFARSVGPTVEKTHKGALVYAGGDDVLAFLPLHTALQCAHDLASSFSQKLSGFKDNQVKPPTLSVGLAIVHHLDPLSDALNLARRAEEEIAKNVPNKDALAIRVNKRSGEGFTVAGKRENLYRHLEQLIKFSREDDIPEGTAYELRTMLLRLNPSTDETENPTEDQLDYYWSLQNAIQADTVRILQRKLSKLIEQNPEKGRAILQNLLKMLDIEMPLKDVQKQASSKPISKRVEQFINELLVAKVLADARELAKLKE
jgi:CRISPR-associated protein Cmr2